MEEAIRHFHRQFLWKPVVKNGERLARARGFVLGGMGGSHLAADLLAGLKPKIDLVIHSDYGLPAVSNPKSRLWIASSYSGNTEETFDFAAQALKKGFLVAALSVGGKLLEFARENKLPHVALPDTGIQPRSALGFSAIGLAALLREKQTLTELAGLARIIKPASLEKRGKEMARRLYRAAPVICASARNRAVAYNWKIKMNETGKIPAFYNVFPELNHNEMTGFDALPRTKKLSERFHFIFLADDADHPKIQKRMEVTRKLYEDRGLPVAEVALEGGTALEKTFSSLLVADWTALHLSKLYGTEAEQVPMVEEFKRIITGRVQS